MDFVLDASRERRDNSSRLCRRITRWPLYAISFAVSLAGEASRTRLSLPFLCTATLGVAVEHMLVRVLVVVGGTQHGGDPKETP